MERNRRLCREARERMERAFDGSLSVEERFALEEHASGCERCGGELARMQVLSEELLRLPEAPVHGLDVEAAVLAVRARIDAQEAPVTQPRSAGRWALAAAAVVLGLVWRGMGEQGDETGEQLAVEADGEGEHDVPVAQGTGESLLAEGVGQPSAADLVEYETEVDAERRTAVLASLRGLLDEALAGQDPEGLDAGWTRGFLERSTEELGSSWPLEGLLRELVEDADGRIASAALRGLAAAGGRLAVRDVERALELPGLLPAAAQALVDMGNLGERALARAWRMPEVRDLVQGRLLEMDGAWRCEFVALTVRGRRGELRGASGSLAELLVSAGEEGLRDLLELGARGDLDQAALVAAVAQADGELAASVILELAEERGGQGREPFLLAAAGAVRGEFLLDWVLDRAERSRHRELVADALAHFDAQRARAGLMRLEASRRMDPVAFLDAWSLAARRSPWGMREFAFGLVRDLDRVAAGRLLELCVASDEQAALPAGFALCGVGILPAAERRDALLALGERCGAEQLDALMQLFWGLTGDDAPVAAALLVTVQRIGGEAASARLMGDFPAPVIDRVLRRLASNRGSGRNATYTLSYLLETTLAARRPLATLDTTELR